MVSMRPRVGRLNDAQRFSAKQKLDRVNGDRVLFSLALSASAPCADVMPVPLPTIGRGQWIAGGIDRCRVRAWVHFKTKNSIASTAIEFFC
jgi:hypothetical protein